MLAVMAVVVEFVSFYFAAEGVAVHAQLLGGAGLVAVRDVQNLFDEALFKFAHGFVEENAVFDHLHHQAFQLILHVATLRKSFVPSFKPL